VTSTLQHPAAAAAASVAPTPIFFPVRSSYVRFSALNAKKYKKLDESECADFANAPPYAPAAPSSRNTRANFVTHWGHQKPLPSSSASELFPRAALSAWIRVFTVSIGYNASVPNNPPSAPANARVVVSRAVSSEAIEPCERVEPSRRARRDARRTGQGLDEDLIVRRELARRLDDGRRRRRRRHREKSVEKCGAARRDGRRGGSRLVRTMLTTDATWTPTANKEKRRINF
jgi:hypothetical protein